MAGINNLNPYQESNKFQKYENILSTIKSELINYLQQNNINDVVIGVS
jgi:hypothetical protein